MCKFLRFGLIALAVLSLLIAGIGCSKSAMSTTTTNPQTSNQPPTTTSMPPTTTAKILPTTTTTTPLPTTTTKPPPTTTSNQVIIAGYKFTPQTIVVKARATVTWMNQDPEDHTVTSDVAGIFDKPIAAGGSVSIIFATPGTYPYHCSIHAEMQGTVIVQ
jgi:plastocyanin